MHFEQRATYILERHLSVEESLKPKPAVVERRAQPRANDALPARVWGVDVDDRPFRFRLSARQHERLRSLSAAATSPEVLLAGEPRSKAVQGIGREQGRRDQGHGDKR
jgi:hypothetical protein